MLKVSGLVLSNVLCEHERQVYARRSNKSMEEVPLRHGSVRFGINAIELNNQVYKIDRFVNNTKDYEERLILEISYKLTVDGQYEEDHSHIEQLLNAKAFILTLDREPYIKQGHEVNIKAQKSKRITSYFIKVWANNVVDLEAHSRLKGENSITPKEAMLKACARQQEPVLI